MLVMPRQCVFCEFIVWFTSCHFIATLHMLSILDGNVVEPDCIPIVLEPDFIPIVLEPDCIPIVLEPGCISYMLWVLTKKKWAEQIVMF